VAQFSEANWGERTIGYLPSIERVTAQKYQRIIKNARPFCKIRRAASVNLHAAASDVPIGGDDRGMLLVSSDVEMDVDET